jgi:hypothetical protein
MSDSIEFTSRWPAHMPTSRRRAVIAAALAVPLLWATYAALARRRRRPQASTSFAAFLKEVPTDAGAHDAGARSCLDFVTHCALGRLLLCWSRPSADVHQRISHLAAHQWHVYPVACSPVLRAAVVGQLAATDFGSFLKQRGPSAAAAGAAAQQVQPGPPLTGNSVVVTILFGTEYGFSKEIAEKLAGALRDQPPYWWVWPRIRGAARHCGQHAVGSDTSPPQGCSGLAASPAGRATSAAFSTLGRVL